MSVTDTRDAEPVLVAPILIALNKDLDSGFVELFGAYRRLVFSVAVRVCGHPTVAEDLTAEAFLRRTGRCAATPRSGSWRCSRGPGW
ncbi:MAG TPA: sigma factor [Pseudonocardiaceae bacterium]|nr:sigma factor [Pseudonocardiaceae bacterium]